MFKRKEEPVEHGRYYTEAIGGLRSADGLAKEVQKRLDVGSTNGWVLISSNSYGSAGIGYTLLIWDTEAN